MIKKLLAAAFFSLSAFFCLAQKPLEIGGAYSMAAPLGSLNKNINLVHSLNGQFNYRPAKLNGTWVGLQMGVGLYASKRVPQTYVFTNGATTNTHARFTSSTLNTHVVAGHEFFKNKTVQPYITAKTGFTSFYSSIVIEDPEDTDGCKPLDSDNLLRDISFSYGAGAGLRVDVSEWMAEPRGAWWLDISVNYTGGTPLDYINTKKLLDHDHNSTPADGKALNMKFINVQTGDIHEHKVAEVYTTRIDLLDIKVGLYYRFGGR
ncbi:MAG: hypothetical protein SFU21_14170 [Flavihumibacter sp.]|nr:hypothetical protein [Flavihumibacter sp.]